MGKIINRVAKSEVRIKMIAVEQLHVEKLQ